MSKDKPKKYTQAQLRRRQILSQPSLMPLFRKITDATSMELIENAIFTDSEDVRKILKGKFSAKALGVSELEPLFDAVAMMMVNDPVRPGKFLKAIISPDFYKFKWYTMLTPDPLRTKGFFSRKHTVYVLPRDERTFDTLVHELTHAVEFRLEGGQEKHPLYYQHSASYRQEKARLGAARRSDNGLDYNGPKNQYRDIVQSLVLYSEYPEQFDKELIARITQIFAIPGGRDWLKTAEPDLYSLYSEHFVPLAKQFVQDQRLILYARHGEEERFGKMLADKDRFHPEIVFAAGMEAVSQGHFEIADQAFSDNGAAVLQLAGVQPGTPSEERNRTAYLKQKKSNLPSSNISDEVVQQALISARQGKHFDRVDAIISVYKDMRLLPEQIRDIAGKEEVFFAGQVNEGSEVYRAIGAEGQARLKEMERKFLAFHRAGRAENLLWPDQVDADHWRAITFSSTLMQDIAESPLELARIAAMPIDEVQAVVNIKHRFHAVKDDAAAMQSLIQGPEGRYISKNDIRVALDAALVSNKIVLARDVLALKPDAAQIKDIMKTVVDIQDKEGDEALHKQTFMSLAVAIAKDDQFKPVVEELYNALLRGGNERHLRAGVRAIIQMAQQQGVNALEVYKDTFQSIMGEPYGIMLDTAVPERQLKSGNAKVQEKIFNLRVALGGMLKKQLGAQEYEISREHAVAIGSIMHETLQKIGAIVPTRMHRITGGLSIRKDRPLTEADKDMLREDIRTVLGARDGVWAQRVGPERSPGQDGGGLQRPSDGAGRY